MRAIFPILLAAALGFGICYLILGPGDDEAGQEPHEPPAKPDPESERMGERFGLKTGTLSVAVRRVDGKKLDLAEVGYLVPGGQPRWLMAQGGRRVITDAPLGKVTAIARAPGFDIAEQECHVVAGVRADVVINIRPRKSSSPAKSDG